MLRPACVAEKTPEPSNSVFVDSTRSAAPPIIVGVKCLNACITFLPASRVATSSPAGNVGSASIQPGRGLPVRSASQSSRSFGNASAQRSKRSLPLLLGLDPGRPRVHVLVDLVRHVEVLVRIEPERLLGGADLVLAERRAVRLGGVDRVRRAVGDVAADDDQRRALLLGLRGADRPLERAEVLGVRDRLHVPAVRLEALALVLGREAERRRAVDRDVVVVVEVDEPAEAEVAGDRRGLHRDALHHVAVGADRVDAPVDDVVVGPVVALGEEAVGDREADAVREALPERARRRLDALGQEVLRMAGRARLPLAEALQLLEREVVAGEVERGVLEDAGVAGREDEAVAVRPVRVRRVVAQHPR